MVECGGLENRLSVIFGYEGSNPSSSASFILSFFAELLGFFYLETQLNMNRNLIIEWVNLITT